MPRVWLRPLPVRVVARLARGVSTFATSWPVRRSAIPIAGLGCFLSTLSTFRDSHRGPRVLPQHSIDELATSSFRDSPRGPRAPSQPSIEPAPRGIGIVPFFDGRSFPPKTVFNIRMRLRAAKALPERAVTTVRNFFKCALRVGARSCERAVPELCAQPL